MPIMKNKVGDIAIAVGQTIRKQGERLKFSQESFADYIRIDRSNYGAIERGERNISLYTVSRIALALNIEVGDLFPSLSLINDILK